jgi:hypothetical protein
VYSNIVRLTARIKVLVWLVLFPAVVLAQETVIRGKITDAFSGDPIPFVNVVFKGTSIGTTTDFERYKRGLRKQSIFSLRRR